MPRIAVESALADVLSDQWDLIPLRIPTGWAIQHNGFLARRTGNGMVELDVTQDLLAAYKLPPASEGRYSIDPQSWWRLLRIDIGWYELQPEGEFRLRVLDPDWEHTRRVYRTSRIERLVATLERWWPQCADPAFPTGEVRD